MKSSDQSNVFASSESANVTLPDGFAQHSKTDPSAGGSSGVSVYSTSPSTRRVTHVLQMPIRQLNAGSWPCCSANSSSDAQAGFHATGSSCGLKRTVVVLVAVV